MSGPYDHQYGAFSQDSSSYQIQYPSYNQSVTSTYPSGGFSQPAQSQYQTQPYYYNDATNPQDQYAYQQPNYPEPNPNTSYYNSAPNAGGAEADRGLMGAVAGGAAGAWGGHKAGHGVLGALGGAILGSLTEDYAKKNKHGKRNQHKPSGASNAVMAGGVGSVASSLFSSKR